MTVGVITDEGRHLLKCWACGPGTEDQPNVRYAKHVSRVLAYERAVEAAERLGVFSIAEVVQAIGRGPTAYTMARHAVHDMALHGLIRCMHRGGPQRPGRQGSCYRWELVP